jgi:hypothetical protein
LGDNKTRDDKAKNQKDESNVSWNSFHLKPQISFETALQYNGCEVERQGCVILSCPIFSSAFSAYLCGLCVEFIYKTINAENAEKSFKLGHHWILREALLDGSFPRSVE